MKLARILVIVLLLLASVAVCTASVPAMLNYQGRLAQASGQPVADGVQTLTFALYEQQSGGAPLWSETQQVQVSGGLFHVLLGSVALLPDAAFAGNTWLETRVSGTALTPRTRIVSSGYAMRSRIAETVQDGSITSAKLAADEASLAVVSDGAMHAAGGRIGIGTASPDAPLAISGVQAYARLTSTDAYYGSVLELRNNADDAFMLGAINFMNNNDYPGQIGYVRSNEMTFRVNGTDRMRIGPSGNVGIGTSNPLAPLDVNGMVRTSQIGTTDDTTLDLKVDGITQLRLQPALFGTVNLIGGASTSSVVADSYACTISGGASHLVTDNYSTIGGGLQNQAGNNDNSSSGNAVATVAGGERNKATGTWSTVGGGLQNTASGKYSAVGAGWANNASGESSAVAGGRSNSATQSYSFVGGGYSNVASGWQATVPGGVSNSAAGMYSFAAGRQAKSNHTGAYVWGDSTQADVASTGNNQYIVRASGGVWFGSTSSPSIPSGRFINTSTGGYLSSGGYWTNNSSRDAKENYEPVDARDTLAKLARLPISSWNYRTEGREVRHIGPTAQDFASAFGMGCDEKAIATVDADGIALSAIQGLDSVVQEVRAENAGLRKELTGLRQELAELRALLREQGRSDGSDVSASASETR